jgi:beta-lactamase superfamily II metal-dependent hydrolase
VYHGERRIAELIITHLHEDHFTDIGSFCRNQEDKPKSLLRDKATLNFIDEKIREASDDNPKKEILQQFRSFQKEYDQDAERIDWGFDFFDCRQLSYKDAEVINSNRDKIINNRSYIIGIGYAGKKILLPGDIEMEGWEKAFEYSTIRDIIKDTNFFVTSHHGRESGCNPDILKYTGIPDIYIVSAKANDDTFYNFYSKPSNAKGYTVYGDSQASRVISTKRQDLSIKIIIDEYGRNAIVPIVTKDNLSEHQEWLTQRRTQQVLYGRL